MLKFGTLLAFFIIFAGCKKEAFIKSDLTESNIKGNVVSYREVKYSANGKPGLQAEKAFALLETERFYNSNGNIIKELQNSPILGAGYVRIISYNEQNKIILDKFYDLDSNLLIENVFVYLEAENKIICYDKLNRQNNSESIWLNDSMKTKEFVYSESGLLNKEINYIYNDQNELIEVYSKVYDEFGELAKIEIDDYDKSGLISVSHSEFDSDSSHIFENEYSQSIEYNEKGDIIKIWTVGNGKDTKTTFFYGYDHMGNWITRIEYLDGYSQNFHERTFRYKEK